MSLCVLHIDVRTRYRLHVYSRNVGTLSVLTSFFVVFPSLRFPRFLLISSLAFIYLRATS